VAAFSTTYRTLVDLHAPKEYSWHQSFTELQTVMDGEIKIMYASGDVYPLKELRVIDQNVKKLYPLLLDGLGEVTQEVFIGYCPKLMESNERFLVGGVPDID
jgi:hypothetical protein